MSLESRGKRKYYYRGRRVNGRVVKEYVARGDEADSLAERIQAEKARRALIQRVEKKLDELDALCDLFFEAWMYAAGYHRPKRGRWRKRRDAANRNAAVRDEPEAAGSASRAA